MRKSKAARKAKRKIKRAVKHIKIPAKKVRQDELLKLILPQSPEDRRLMEDKGGY